MRLPCPESIDKCEKCGGQLSFQVPGARVIGYRCRECGTHFSYHRVTPYSVKDKADKILADWNDICTELDVEHFLVKGTCLGMVREKGYIKGDWDIDVYVKIKEEDFPKVIVPKLVESGFMTHGLRYHFDNTLGSGLHFARDCILLDVHFVLPLDEEFLKSFDKIVYEGNNYRLPHPAEAYLRHTYGANWRIPLWKLTGRPEPA